MIHIAASLLSANMAQLGAEALSLQEARVDALHLDIMDHHYVPNLSFGPQLLPALRHAGVTLPLDVHLMVSPLETILNTFIQVQPQHITFHPETTPCPHRAIMQIKASGASAGVALNPGQPIEQVLALAPWVDRVLVMSVNPGFGGQAFIPTTLDTLHRLNEARRRHDWPFELWVDGGVQRDRIPSLIQQGVDGVVIGYELIQAASRLDYIKEAKSN